MYYHFFYQIAPICLAVGIPFLITLIGTAVYNSLSTKRDSAIANLTQISQALYILLSEINKESKEFKNMTLYSAYAKELEARRYLIKRSIELNSAENMASAILKYKEFISSWHYEDNELCDFGKILIQSFMRFRRKSKSSKQKYNQAALLYNDSLKCILIKPVVTIMNIKPLSEI